MTACSVCGATVADCVAVIPSEVCIRLVFGTDTEWDFVLLDGDGEPVDITADDVRLTVKDEIGGTLKIQKTNAAGTHADPTNGRTVFTLAPGDITDTPDGDRWFWVYEVRRFIGGAGGDEAIHLQGDFVVDPAV